MRLQFKMIFSYVFYLLIYLDMKTRDYGYSLVSTRDKRRETRRTCISFCSVHVLILRPLSFFAEIRDCLQTSKALSYKTCTQQKDMEFSTLGFVNPSFLSYLKKYTRTDFSLSGFLDSYSCVL